MPVELFQESGASDVSCKPQVLRKHMEYYGRAIWVITPFRYRSTPPIQLRYRWGRSPDLTPTMNAGAAELTQFYRLTWLTKLSKYDTANRHGKLSQLGL
jgi:hypothetical protein